MCSRLDNSCLLPFAILTCFCAVDGAVLANSPVLVALCEAAVLWPGAHVDVVVSLGTGTVTPRAQVPSGVVSWAKTMLELATSSTFSNSLAAGLLGPNRFFRLDAPGGGDFDLTEMRLDQLAAMLALGRRYVARCAAEGIFSRLCAALGVEAASDHPGSGQHGDAGSGVAGAGAGAGRTSGSDESESVEMTMPTRMPAAQQVTAGATSDAAALYSLGALF